jgi:hypothetical protein
LVPLAVFGRGAPARERINAVVLCAALLIPSTFCSAGDLPASLLQYQIEVRLDPQTRTLSGHEVIRWTNPSTTTIVDRVPLHLYLNAFANQGSTWMRTGLNRYLSIEDILERFDDPWGWCEPTRIRQADRELDWRAIAPDDGNPLDRTLIEVRLASPVPPGGKLELDVKFDARLPVPFARTGGFGDFFLLGQWFPKLAAFETRGVRGARADRWSEHQFHGRTEFYADFADFDVTVGLPLGWAVVATGRADSEETREGVAWHRFTQRAVHDFAIAAGAQMTDVVSSYDPAGLGGPVEIHLFMDRMRTSQAARWLRIVQQSLDTMGSRVGPYPYRTLTVVFAPFNAIETWGMEYPTLITAGGADPLWDLPVFDQLTANELIIPHEFAHQYFYGVIASNEFEEAFLDEGFTEFWNDEIMGDALGDNIGELLGRPLKLSTKERVGEPRPGDAVPAMRVRPSFLARGYQISTQFYVRPTATLRTLERLFGRQALDRVFAAYYKRWAFRHPRLEDFLDVAREAGGHEVADFLDEAFSESSVPDYRVDSFETQRWTPPLGRFVTGSGVVDASVAREGDRDLVGLDPAAREESGRVTVEVLDPGSSNDDRWGAIRRQTVEPIRRDPEPGWVRAKNEYDVSEVRLAGPGWRHLPVDVLFRFADGAEVRQTWDGTAVYRGYRFLRGAPLSEVEVDPEGRIALDGNPANNGRLRQPDLSFTIDWAAWLTSAMQAVLEGASQWL